MTATIGFCWEPPAGKDFPPKLSEIDIAGRPEQTVYLVILVRGLSLGIHHLRVDCVAFEDSGRPASTTDVAFEHHSTSTSEVFGFCLPVKVRASGRLVGILAEFGDKLAETELVIIRKH